MGSGGEWWGVVGSGTSPDFLNRAPGKSTGPLLTKVSNFGQLGDELNIALFS